MRSGRRSVGRCSALTLTLTFARSLAHRFAREKRAKARARTSRWLSFSLCDFAAYSSATHSAFVRPFVRPHTLVLCLKALGSQQLLHVC